jgi:serine/threonine-protein kinase
MDSLRWEQMQILFHQALERPEGERSAYVAAAAGGDSDMAAAVMGMIQADSRNTSLLDRGVEEVARQVVEGSVDAAAIGECGPYRPQKLLGEGGMGVVWLARREDTAQVVAVKFLANAGLSPARREHFAGEIMTLARLKHPFIARLYDAGTIPGGAPWFAMEYVEGLRLTAYLREHPCSIRDRLRLFRSICDAVQYAHSKEIIHRDLKPSNILVEIDGTPKLLDFGIAKQLQNVNEPSDQTRAGLRFLSPDHAAPEWVQGGEVGFYTDVYSLGVILYEMLTGGLPDRATDLPEKPSALVRKTSSASATELGKAAWSDLDVLCLKAMHRDPGERYRSVEGLLRDIDHFLKGEPLEARPDTLAYRLGKFAARNRRSVTAALLVFTLVAGLVVYFTARLAGERDRANRERETATAMNRFLSDDLLGRADPFRSRNAGETFAQVVKQASPRIDLQFRAEPLIAARLHQTLAGAFDRRSDFPQARQEYEQADRLFRQAEGPLSQDLARLRLERAAMEARSFEGGSLARAKSLLADAEQMMARIAKPQPDLAVWRYTARGFIAVAETDAASIEQNFSAALKAASADPSFEESARERIKEGIAVSYIRRGDGARAEPLYREVIAALSRTAGPESPDVLRARIYLAQSLLVQHKFADAVREADAIYPSLVKALGADHEVVLALLGTRAAAEGSLARWDDAIRDDLTVYGIAVRKQGPASLFAIGMLSDAALSQCQAGRFAEGEANARKAFQESSKAFGLRAGLTGGVAYTLASCLSKRNRLDEAARLLENIDVSATAQQSGDPNVGADIALLQGEVAARRGDMASAKRFADRAEAGLNGPTASDGDRKELQDLRAAIAAHGK